MKCEDPLVRQRLAVLELAEALGNVSEACRRHGVSRTQFYEYKRRFQRQGLSGLEDLPPVHHSHPMTTPPEVVEGILAASLAHPARGCNFLADMLHREGIDVSATTLQRVLNRHRLGTCHERWLELEEKSAGGAMALSAEQLSFLEKQNPCWKERRRESARPGDLLCQDTCYLGPFHGAGDVYLHMVVDTYSGYAFGAPHPSKQPEAAVAVLAEEALPFYRARGLDIGAVLTRHRRAYCGMEDHPYQRYLALSGITHRRTYRPQTNGYVERFKHTVLHEFFESVIRDRLYESVTAFEVDLGAWLAYYNTERPHRGYPNQGRRPLEGIDHYLDAAQNGAR